jgi:hypothetical protein
MIPKATISFSSLTLRQMYAFTPEGASLDFQAARHASYEPGLSVHAVSATHFAISSSLIVSQRRYYGLT